ncbi:hypothetical protein R75461_08406 [Paraburkholderia nemoris]|uniref:hypothetical protein n=1 Tax=Paraburkholderia nemoris TaxID=2793076 RepID=UPI00190B42AC|nr:MULTISPECIES: hypothetical protein [Paraburkholderia]MBK3746064.1 hypothetical protein [Paraburkholderia aspalathi]MBK3787177.1 hypothetical protein [Paraburkholderia aspalathi]CAE6859673.1 hypothetical protein R69619_07849 [Paraburkholderia nemoris]CAE6868029.1 hypothetical protein R75461_08406 [Paraburkholderia nemoris]
MPFRYLTPEQTRDIARRRIETLELWLRRFVDDVLTQALGPEYFYTGAHANQQIVKNELRRNASQRRQAEPHRYTRDIDALLLDDLIDLVSKPDLYQSFFEEGFRSAFPLGSVELRSVLKRLLPIRNALSHANPITPHQAERAVCYSDDVIQSLKEFYVSQNRSQEYNAPRLVEFSDSLGNRKTLSQTRGQIHLVDGPALRPGETLIIDVEADASFPEDEYRIEWSVNNISDGEKSTGTRFVLEIDEKHVGDQTMISVMVISNRKWHRHQNFDSLHVVVYKVLPPI